MKNGLVSITGTSKFVEYEEDEVKKVLLQEQIDEIVSKNSIKSMTELFSSQYEQMKKTKSEYNTSSKKYVSGSFEIIYDTEFHYIKKAESILISNKKDEADGIYNYSFVIKNFKIIPVPDGYVIPVLDTGIPVTRDCRVKSDNDKGNQDSICCSSIAISSISRSVMAIVSATRKSSRRTLSGTFTVVL